MSDPTNNEERPPCPSDLAIAPAEKKPRKKGGGKKKARKARRLSWHLAFIDQLTPILHKLLIETLEKLGGVKSFNDFHAKFQDTHNCTIDIDIFRDVVMQSETLAPLFSRLNLIVLPTSSPVSSNLTVQRQTPNDSSAFRHPLSDGLDSESLEDTPPGTLDINFRPLEREGLVAPGSTPAAGGAAVSTPWVPPPDPMAIVFDQHGRPVTRV